MSATVSYIPLARVRVGAGASSIDNAHIDDLRPYAMPYRPGLPMGLAGATSATRFVGAWATQGPPATGSFQTGDWGFDSFGARWWCASGGSPGTWLYGGGGQYFGRIHHSSPLTLGVSGFSALPMTAVDFDPSNMTGGGGASVVQVPATFPNPTSWRFKAKLAFNPDPPTTIHDIRLYFATNLTANPETSGYPGTMAAPVPGASYMQMEHGDIMRLAPGTSVWLMLLNNVGSGGTITTQADGRFSYLTWELVGC